MEKQQSAQTTAQDMKDRQNWVVQPDMTIGEVIDKYPFLASVFTKYGLHCVGCHVSPYETLEQGSLGYGMSQEDFGTMMEEANKVVGQEHSISHSSKMTGTAGTIAKQQGTLAISDAAFGKAKELFQRAGVAEAEGLRIKVVPGGCSGFSYKFGFDKKREADAVFEGQAFNVFVDPQSLSMLNGAKVDYIDNLQGSGFKISNPNAASTCGCGSSFS